MKLADLRRLAIRKQTAVRFRLRNGMECVMTEHGVARVPELAGVPDFNLEEELAAAREFVLESGTGEAAPWRLTRDELAALAEPGAGPGPVHEDE